MSKLVLSELALLVLHDCICGNFYHSTINASALLCVLRKNLEEDSFDMLKINMLLSTGNNFMICLFDFERFSSESRFAFFFFNSYIM